jgi:hypothetical protein
MPNKKLMVESVIVTLKSEKSMVINIEESKKSCSGTKNEKSRNKFAKNSSRG